MKRKIFLILTLIFCIIFYGCVGSANYRGMDLTTNVRSGQIYNLRNYGDNDIDFLRQSEKLMKNGFLNTSTEEYGYYIISYENLNTYFGLGGWAWFQAFLLYIPSFIGVPTDNQNFRMRASLSIYDSDGNRIKHYSKTGNSFTQVAGLYYGHNPTRRVERELNKLFSDILQTASMESHAINQALAAAGPITQEKDPIARAAIRGSSVAAAPSSYSPPATSYSQQPAQPATPNVGQQIAEAFRSPIDSGTYGLAGTNLKIRIATIASSGMLTLIYEDGRTQMCSYRIDGNNMIINLPNGTAVYTIQSRTSFSGSDGLWVRTGF